MTTFSSLVSYYGHPNNSDWADRPNKLWGIFGSTVNSQFKKVYFFFLKSKVVWFKKDLCSESKNRSSEKNALCRWICNLRSFLNREFTVLSGQILSLCIPSMSFWITKPLFCKKLSYKFTYLLLFLHFRSHKMA